MKTKANILTDKITDKMDELRFKLKTLDGGSCLKNLPVREDNHVLM